MTGIKTKAHYQILDGLRGVAALLVLCYHVFEGFATSPLDQRFNHGYLAVDFFFILSGFVIGYAYDDRWNKMSVKTFFKRRLIRLHPMVIIGAVFGLAAFLIQGSVRWDGTQVPLYLALGAFVMTVFMLPSWPGWGTEVRGNAELFPLNGPNWSLFLEYIGNIAYALVLRRLSDRSLKWLVAVLAAGLAVYSIGNLSTYGYMGVGWTFANNGLVGGLLRMGFSYSMGMLLARSFTPRKIKGAFWICAFILTFLITTPRIMPDKLWINGLYDALCIIVIFPIVLCIGASGVSGNAVSEKICKFLGDISYPVYAIHYPFMYLFYAWVWKNGYSFSESGLVGFGVAGACIILAWLLLKFYDQPLRKYLNDPSSSK